MAFMLQALEIRSLIYNKYIVWHSCDIIHLLHAGEGNMKMYSPKSIIFPDDNARGEYDTHG